MNSREAFEYTMEWEGGGRVHNVPGDRGGVTKWGVSSRAYPDLDIPSLLKSSAEWIYRKDYWEAVTADLLPKSIRAEVVDFAFTSGATNAGSVLQGAVNYIIEVRELDLDYLQQDGVIGPKTRAAVWAMPGHLLRVFRVYRAQFYMRIALRNHSQSKFINGWLRRASGERALGT